MNESILVEPSARHDLAALEFHLVLLARARVALVGDRLLATTTEIDDDAPATAIYELDMDLRLVRARYSETYWDVHRRLELEGRIAHTRETCPERDGPPAIHVWAAQGGWTRTLPAARNGPTPR